MAEKSYNDALLDEILNEIEVRRKTTAHSTGSTEELRLAAQPGVTKILEEEAGRRSDVKTDAVKTASPAAKPAQKPVQPAPELSPIRKRPVPTFTDVLEEFTRDSAGGAVGDDTAVFVAPNYGPPQQADISDTANEILKHDMALENPEDLLDAINPLEVVSAAKKATAAKPADNLLSGDTQGIAGGDLKQIAAHAATGLIKTGEDDSVFTTAEVGVKAYVPAASHTVVHVKSPAAAGSNVSDLRRVKLDGTAQIPGLTPDAGSSIRAVRGNDALVQALKKKISERREAETGSVNIVSDKTIVSRPDSAAVSAKYPDTTSATSANSARGTRPVPPLNALNIDYQKQIIHDISTSLSLIKDPDVAEKKLEELEKKRGRRLRDFVLERDENEEQKPDPRYYDDAESLKEDDFDDTKDVREALTASGKSLKLRLALLSVLTLIAVAVAVCNDLGVPLAYRIAGVFGTAFLDRRFEPTGYLFFFLILGVLGLAVCSEAVIQGIGKIFRGKGDSDSLTAVAAVLPVFAVLPHLSGFDLVQRGRAGVFVAAGLCSLLFNTIGKLLMYARATRNFRFVSGDTVKYYGDILTDSEKAAALTKGVLSESPTLLTMRKTELLTEFLPGSYQNDLADRISKTAIPLAFASSVLVSIAVYFLPNGTLDLSHSIPWAVSCGTAVFSAVSGFAMTFLVNNPLYRVSKRLDNNRAVVLGYDAAIKFSEVNAVLFDANVLFPPGTVIFKNVKRCASPGVTNTVQIDEAIITAASLAIKSGSILSYMFYDMIADNGELLRDAENCIYEANMGVTGWIGNKRVMLGNRDQMKHHGVWVPDIKKEKKYCSENSDVIYLAIAGEIAAMFFIELIPNSEIKLRLKQLDADNVALIIRAKDSLVTVNKLAEIFELDPERLRILPFDMFGAFDESVKYTSRGSGALACDGTLTAFAHGLTAAKRAAASIAHTTWIVITGMFLALILSFIFALFAKPDLLTVTNVLIYNGGVLLLLLIAQAFKRYD